MLGKTNKRTTNLGAEFGLSQNCQNHWWHCLAENNADHNDTGFKLGTEQNSERHHG